MHHSACRRLGPCLLNAAGVSMMANALKLPTPVAFLTDALSAVVQIPELCTASDNFGRKIRGFTTAVLRRVSRHRWNESIALRGSSEVGSCILSHIKEMQTHATNLTLYSDACGGQNRIFSLCACGYILLRAVSTCSLILTTSL